MYLYNEVNTATMYMERVLIRLLKCLDFKGDEFSFHRNRSSITKEM